jgi:excisionase family DNA binding protein
MRHLDRLAFFIMQTLATDIENIGRALTATEVGQLLQLHKATIHRLANTGELPHYRIGSCVRFDCRAVARFLREKEQV